MIMIMENLGSDYLVWDKAGEIEFIRAVKEPVWCEFRLESATLDEIRAAAASGEKYLRWMPVDVLTASGEIVARVRKQIYVRLKERERPR